MGPGEVLLTSTVFFDQAGQECGGVSGQAAFAGAHPVHHDACDFHLNYVSLLGHVVERMRIQLPCKQAFFGCCLECLHANTLSVSAKITN